MSYSWFRWASPVRKVAPSMQWNLGASDTRKLVDIVKDLPGFGNDQDRKSILEYALGLSERAKAAVSLNLQGDPTQVATRVIAHLSRFGQLEDGKDVLELFLEVVVS